MVQPIHWTAQATGLNVTATSARGVTWFPGFRCSKREEWTDWRLVVVQLPRTADSLSRSHEITLMVPDVGWGPGGRTGRSEEVPEDDVTLG